MVDQVEEFAAFFVKRMAWGIVFFLGKKDSPYKFSINLDIS